MPAPRERAGLELLHCSREPHPGMRVCPEGSAGTPSATPIHSSKPRREPGDLWLRAAPPGQPVPLLRRRPSGCWMLHSLLSIPCLFPTRVGSWGRRTRPASRARRGYPLHIDTLFPLPRAPRSSVHRGRGSGRERSRQMPSRRAAERRGAEAGGVGRCCSGAVLVFSAPHRSTRDANSFFISSWESQGIIQARGCHLPRGITFGNSLSSSVLCFQHPPAHPSSTNPLGQWITPAAEPSREMLALKEGVGSKSIPPVSSSRGWEAPPSRAVRSPVPSPRREPCGLFMCGPGSSSDLPWLYIACDAVIQVQPGRGIYFLQRLGSERSENRRGNARAVRFPVCGVQAPAREPGTLSWSVGLVMTMGQRRNVWRG